VVVRRGLHAGDPRLQHRVDARPAQSPATAPAQTPAGPARAGRGAPVRRGAGRVAARRRARPDAPSSATGVVAVLGTESTIASDSYGMELRKLAPHLELIQQACPLWAALVEAGELDGPGTEWFLRRALDPVLNSGRRPQRILLGCTHYPLLLPAIRSLVPAGVEILAQGEVVASRLKIGWNAIPTRKRGSAGAHSGGL